MPKHPKPTNAERRSKANLRERQRVSEMNGMFDALLSLLPPSNFKTRLSRAQILREASSYIIRLTRYLEASNDGIDAPTVFPHIFTEERKSNKNAIRRPLKLKERGAVAAFISRHELPPLPPITAPAVPIPILAQTTMPTLIWPPTSGYIAYF